MLVLLQLLWWLRLVCTFARYFANISRALPSHNYLGENISACVSTTYELMSPIIATIDCRTRRSDESHVRVGWGVKKSGNVLKNFRTGPIHVASRSEMNAKLPRGGASSLRTARVIFNRETSSSVSHGEREPATVSRRREKTSIRIDWPILQAHPGSAPFHQPRPRRDDFLSLFLSFLLSLAERRADNSN